MEEKKTVTEEFISMFNDKESATKMLNDIKEIFCYVQIERGAKSLSRTVPLEDISNMCRALGFYPTEKENEDMMNEIKYKDYMNAGQLLNEITLEEFIQLFVNHKPVTKEDLGELKKVFKILGDEKAKEDPNATPDVTREEFLNFLKTRGEHFKEKDLITFVKPLFEQNSSDTEDQEGEENYHIRETISIDWFIEDVLKGKQIK